LIRMLFDAVQVGPGANLRAYWRVVEAQVE